MVTSRILILVALTISGGSALPSGMTQAFAKELLLIDKADNKIHLKYDDERIHCLSIELYGPLKSDFNCDLLSPIQEPDLQNITILYQEAGGVHFHKLIIPFFQLADHGDGDYEAILEFKDGLVEEAFVQIRGTYPERPVICLSKNCNSTTNSEPD